MSDEAAFDRWMLGVDRALQKLTGLTAGDFPDWSWMDQFESRATPAHAADAMLEECFPEYLKHDCGEFGEEAA